MPDPPRFVTVDDYEALAREVLTPAVTEFLAGGAGDERTLASNRRAFDRWVLRPRFLRGVAAADPSTELFGSPLALPVLIAPWAYQRTVFSTLFQRLKKDQCLKWRLLVKIIAMA